MNEVNRNEVNRNEVNRNEVTETTLNGMIFGSFIHGDDDLFRTTVSEFVNDTTTHPIVKYKAFIAVFLLALSGFIILGLLHGNQIIHHRSWKHLFVPVSELRDKYAELTDSDEYDRLFNYNYSVGGGRSNNMSAASVFRQAVEGFDVKKLPPVPNTQDGKATNKNGGFASADVKGAEKVSAAKKKTPCPTDCGQYVDLKGQINTLSKMVDVVKDQKDRIKQNADAIQAVGKQIEDLNKSLSPGGQVNIQL